MGPDMSVASAETRRYGTLKGGYVLKKESAALEMVIIATGSEVQYAVKAAEDLPAGVKKIAMEAGVTGLWYKYADTVIGVDKFGMSAPGDLVMSEYGMTPENLVKEVKAR